KAAATRAEEFPSDRSRPTRELVRRINVPIRDLGGEPPFHRPRIVQELAECAQITSAVEHIDPLCYQSPQRQQIVGVITPPSALYMLVEDCVRVSLKPSVEQHQTIFELNEPLRAQRHVS